MQFSQICASFSLADGPPPLIRFLVVLTGQLILQVLKVLVAVLVHSNKGSGLGVTCIISVSTVFSSLFPMASYPERTDVLMRAKRIDQSTCEEQLRGFHERTAIWWA